MLHGGISINEESFQKKVLEWDLHPPPIVGKSELHKYGFGKEALKLMLNYLKHRQQS